MIRVCLLGPGGRPGPGGPPFLKLVTLPPLGRWHTDLYRLANGVPAQPPIRTVSRSNDAVARLD